MSKAYVFLADGFEEIEGLTVVDVLRRAGVDTVTVSVMGRKEISGSHGIPVGADDVFEKLDMSDADLLVLPGGMPGTLHLKAHEGLRELLVTADREEKYLAAICAAPSVLSELGMLKGRKACAYPSFEETLDCAEVLKVPVVTDGHITTGRGMGAAIPFALRLTEILCGKGDSLRKRESRGDQDIYRVQCVKNTGNMRIYVLYCFNDCKGVFPQASGGQYLRPLYIQGGRK